MLIEDESRIASFPADCPFCTIDPGRIWIETADAIAVPDAYPIAEGHMLVVPRKHVTTIYELTTTEPHTIGCTLNHRSCNRLYHGWYFN